MSEHATIEVSWTHVDDVAIERGVEVLSAAESQRRDAFTHEDARDHFVAARGLLWHRLDELGVPRSEPELGPHGKPSISGAPPYNLSHSNGAAALAIVTTSGLEVGIDIEAPWRRTDFDAISARFFATSERDSLAAYPIETRRVRFFELWTLKEAVLKATGKGLTTPLASVVFADVDKKWKLADGLAGEWSLKTWRIASGHVLSAAVNAAEVAWEGPTLRVLR